MGAGDVIGRGAPKGDGDVIGPGAPKGAGDVIGVASKKAFDAEGNEDKSPE
jgi:hypothetical protein